MFRKHFSLLQQKTTSTATTAQRFGDLLRNNNSNNNNATTSSPSPTVQQVSRPFVRDVRSLRNRVKLDDFAQKRNEIAKLISTQQNATAPSNNNTKIRTSFENNNNNNSNALSIINEQIHNMADRNGHILSDELMFQTLRMNAESGDIVTAAEILNRIVQQEGRMRNISSSASSSSSLDALNGIDLLLQSVLSMMSSTSSHSIYSEILQNSVLGTIQYNASSSNPYLQLRIDNTNNSFAIRQEGNNNNTNTSGDAIYSALRPHVQSIIENIFQLFVTSSSSIPAGLENLFSSVVHVSIAFDLFEYRQHQQQQQGANVMNISNVLRVVKSMTNEKSVNDAEAISLIDGALFSAVRQIFFAEKVLRNSSEIKNELLEATLSELKSIVASSSNRFPFSSLWLEENEKGDPLRSLIVSEVNLLNNFGSSKDINVVLEHFEKIFSNNSNNENLSNDEKFLLPLLLLIVAESSSNGSGEGVAKYSETFNILRKIFSNSNNDDSSSSSSSSITTSQNILQLSLELLSNIFIKSRCEILSSSSPISLEDVNSPLGALVEEKMILRNLRLSLLAHQLVDHQNEMLNLANLNNNNNNNTLLNSSLAKFFSIVEPYLVKNDSDLGQEIALLEERKLLRRQEIVANNNGTVDETNHHQQSQNSNNKSGDVNSSSSSSHDDFADITTDDFASSQKETVNHQLNKQQQQQEEEVDEFEQILSSSNNTSTKNTSQSLNSNQGDSDKEFSTHDENQMKYSSLPLHQSHPALRLLALRRRQRLVMRNNNNNYYDDLPIYVFNRIFRNARESGDVTLARKMSEKRRELYDPVKLI